MLNRTILSSSYRLPINNSTPLQELSRVLIVAAQPSRQVTTTTTSKTQQVARQSKRLHPDDHPTSPSLFNDQKFQVRLDNLNLWHSIDTIKRLGHRMVQLDPLEIRRPKTLKELTWNYQLVEELRSSTDVVPTNGFLDTKQPLMAVNELINTVWNIYANSDLGLEYSHMSNQNEIEWLTSQMEKLNEIFHIDKVEQYNVAKLLLECEAFDHFMAAKYPTVKRYGCEGAESMLVILDETLRLCQLHPESADEVTRAIGCIDDVIIGMPHRGRLNLLACLLGFEPAAIFSKINGESEMNLSQAWMAQGDVLSHLSTNIRFVYGLGNQDIGLSRDSPDPINVTLLPNPSHLEVVAPMTAGSARGRAHNILHGYTSSPKFVTFDKKFSQDQNFDFQRYFPAVLPIQIHGDASVAGQGIIQETLQMANLPQFSVGGSLHLVLNNQIGYTTDSMAGRSSRHCTDVFKSIEAPIIHVNAQNISSVIRATRLALTYRQKFGKDVVIDLTCYRQHGHNEMDEPSFTQPIMYSKIRSRKTIPQTFCEEIGMSDQDRKQIVDDCKTKLSEAHKNASFFKPDNDNYRNFMLASEFHRDHVCSWNTGYNLASLRSIALTSVQVPENFKVHPNLERVLINDRLKRFGTVENEEALNDIKVDWATAEILAFGSLLEQNYSIRIAGQDVARGTFSTRHVVLFDQETEEPHIPLNVIARNDIEGKIKAQIEVANTILSEEAALAYEFGYSVETCAMTIWEAQFGDFFNTAQSVIDTLISCSETKWLKQSPLTLLLPHGLDGAGPEHSSSRLERFLQLSSSSMDSIDTEAKVNWSVCFPTMPSQYFHLLRRQQIRPFRKPLVVMSPKVIFRHPDCVSELSDFGPEKSFEPVLDDTTVKSREAIDTIVLCSGKFYFNLKELKQKNNMNNVAIIRIEELCPFPIQAIIHTIMKYPNANKDALVWVQEEHKNQGAYGFVATRLSNMAGTRLNYIGRPENELSATGSSLLHKKELEQVTKDFLALRKI